MTRPMQADGPTRTRPRWCPEEMNREHLIKGALPLHAPDFAADATGRRAVLSGTYLGRTRAERDAGQGFGPAAAGDDERYLLAFTVPDVRVQPSGVALRRGVQVWENFLPGFSALAGPVQALLRQDYQASIGAD